MDNFSQQKDEIEALSSIYGNDWKAESDSSNSFSIELDSSVKLFITFNSDYPSQAPPSYQLLAPSLSRSTKQEINSAFENIYLENIGGPVIFQWIERLREIVNEVRDQKVVDSVQDEESVSSETYSGNNKESHVEPEESMDSANFKIITGPPIHDRRSTFQGHFCPVKSQSDVQSVMSLLLENKKIFQATHNISAYRIKSETGSIIQDCNDDGENHAGGRLLHLLQILNVTDVLVVVSRWYGGVQLGPDRFRHINNAARQVLVQAGVIK